MGVVIPALLIASLGTCLDLRTYDKKYSSRELFSALNDYTEVPLSEQDVSATYMLLPENSFPYEYFGIPVDLAVIRKHADHKYGLEDYQLKPLKAAAWRHDSIVIFVKFEYRTKDRTLKGHSPNPGKERWHLGYTLDRLREQNATHYVETEHFAGQAFAAYRIQCKSDKDMKKVRDMFTSKLGESGDINGDVVGKFQLFIQELKVNEELKDRMSYNYLYHDNTHSMYSNIILPEKWMTMTEVLPYISRHLRTSVSAELQPLRNLDKSFPEIQIYEKQVDQLKKVDMLMDDVSLARVTLGYYKVHLDQKPEKAKELLELTHSIDKVYDSMFKVVKDASLYKPMDQKQIKEAFDDYDTELNNTGFSTFYKAVRNHIDK